MHLKWILKIQHTNSNSLWSINLFFCPYSYFYVQAKFITDQSIKLLGNQRNVNRNGNTIFSSFCFHSLKIILLTWINMKFSKLSERASMVSSSKPKINKLLTLVSLIITQSPSKNSNKMTPISKTNVSSSVKSKYSKPSTMKTSSNSSKPSESKPFR